MANGSTSTYLVMEKLQICRDSGNTAILLAQVNWKSGDPQIVDKCKITESCFDALKKPAGSLAVLAVDSYYGVSIEIP